MRTRSRPRRTRPACSADLSIAKIRRRRALTLSGRYLTIRSSRRTPGTRPRQVTARRVGRILYAANGSTRPRGRSLLLGHAYGDAGGPRRGPLRDQACVDTARGDRGLRVEGDRRARRVPAVAITKVARRRLQRGWGRVDYTIVATNAGNTTVAGVTVGPADGAAALHADASAGLDPDAGLPPGHSLTSPPLIR